MVLLKGASMLADDISDQICLAGHPAEIDEIIKEAWGRHFAGTLTENDMEILDEAARARREAFQARRTETRPKPRAAPSCVPQASVRRPRRAVPRSPDRAASRQRRRDVGQERWLPPCIASQLTQGEVAVLSIMVREIVNHGFCDIRTTRLPAWPVSAPPWSRTCAGSPRGTAGLTLFTGQGRDRSRSPT